MANCCAATRIADRCYIYDNSIENCDAQLLFRIVDGKLKKSYTKELPEWATFIYDTIEK